MAEIEKIQRSPSTSTVKREGGPTLNTGETVEQINTITKVSEGVSEMAEQTPKSVGAVQTTTSTQKTTTITGVAPVIVAMPDTEEELRKVLHIEIKKKINTLMKHAIELQRNPNPTSARNLVDVVCELRKLTIMMRSLWQLTIDKLKELYRTFFPTPGK